MNTNRISTDIKHAKEALEKKLDSLQTGMDGIPNLLTPSFDSIKNVLSTITTKVDNVRGGVDLNHTALTDLQQRLTAVEGSVGGLESSTYGYVPDSWRAVKNENITSSSFVDIVNITGKGRLHAATGASGGSEYEWKVTVDGVATTIKDQGRSGETYSKTFLTDVQFIVGVEQNRGTVALLNTHNETVSNMSGVYEPLFIPVYDSEKRKNIRFVTNNLGENCTSPTLLLTRGGVPFNKSLRVQCRRVSGSNAVQCCASYSLN